MMQQVTTMPTHAGSVNAAPARASNVIVLEATQAPGPAQAPTNAGQTTEQPARMPGTRRGISPQSADIAFAICACVAVCAIATAAMRIFAPRRDRPVISSGSSPETAERLARIEQAVDAIALEVERISEGQRFTTKLLAEQHTPALPAKERI